MWKFKNTENKYGSIAILLHWLMAILIIGLLILGLYMVGLPISLQKLKLFGWHKELGILVLGLVMIRLWWRLSNVMPNLSALPKWERVAARTVHWSFYFFMLALPLSGWMMSSAAALPVSFFGLFTLPDLVSPNEELFHFFVRIHKWIAYALIATICLHVLAAFKHVVINKDDIMKRMIVP